MNIIKNPLRTLAILMRYTDQAEVLLGYKKRGYGVGKYTGFGGKVKAGETILHAAVRELEEETSLRARACDLAQAGQLRFVFPWKPEWTQQVHVFTLVTWQGQSVETPEMRPAWFSLPEIPYEAMWQDGRYWLPPLLRGESVSIQFTFKEDNNSLLEVRYLETGPG